MADKVKEGCINGLVFNELDGVKVGDIYQYDPHRFSDYYQQYMVIYLYKSMGGKIVQVIFDDGYVGLYESTESVKKDKFIKNVEIKNKIIDYSVLERVTK